MKKLTAMLLALVMMTLPMLGLAASPDEMLQAAVDAGRPLKVEGQLNYGAIPGMDAEIETIINDVVDAIGFTYTEQENQGSFALKLSGNDVLTFAGATEGEDIYINSNLLGGTVAFNGEEGKAILEKLMNLAVSSGMMTEDELAEIKAVLDQAAAQVAAPMEDVDVEDMDLTGLLNVAMELAAKVQTGEVSQQPKNCDAAATVMTFTLTGEDITKLYTEIFKLLQNVPQFTEALKSADTLTINGENVSPEEFVAKLPEMAGEIGKMIEGDIPVAIYMDEAGEPVYGTLAMTMAAEGDTVSMDMNYARLTVNEGVTHAVNVVAKDNNNEGASVSVNVLTSEKKDVVNVAVASLKDNVAEPVVNVDVTVEKEYGETESEEDVLVAVTIVDSDSKEEISFAVEAETEAKLVGEDVVYESDIDLNVMGIEDLLCIKITETTGEAAESIVTADAVRPGQMTEEEFNTYVTEDVASNAMNALMGLIQNLPASALSLLFAE